MYFGLLLLVIALPLVELALLIKVGQLIGFWWTMTIIVATAMIGASVLHAQGFRVLEKIKQAVARGQPPIVPVIDGTLLVLAGVCLMAPGLVTDLFGLLLLVPAARIWLARISLADAIWSETAAGNRSDGGPDPARPSARPAAAEGPIIEGEFRRLDERTIDPSRPREPS